MTTAELILEYVKTLVWPTLAVFLVIFLREPIRTLFARITGDSAEISASGLGFQLNAKFQEKIAELAESSEAGDAPELRESVREAATDFARDQFRALSSAFFGTPLATRQEAARALARVAPNLSVDDLVDFAASPINGERVGAGIGLRAMIGHSPETCRDPRVRLAVQKLLDDSSSRVRYRAVHAAQACPELNTALRDQVSRLVPFSALVVVYAWCCGHGGRMSSSWRMRCWVAVSRSSVMPWAV